jgi:serine/threonine-protein kinase
MAPSEPNGPRKAAEKDSPDVSRRASLDAGALCPATETSTSSTLDNEITRVVVEQGLATSEEIEECRSLREKIFQENPSSQKTLAEVLLEQGVVTPRQFKRVRRVIEESRRGQQIPGYQIQGKLGAGAMATVFKARQLSLDRIVAVKVLPKRLSENPEYVDLFYKEGKAAAKLNHPNIVQAIDVGEASGYHYFVMEYVEGHRLYDEMPPGKVFSEADALRIIIQVARALEHAHSQGFIHRDVKPKNIMMTRDGTAKLADMGLARAVADTDSAQAEAGRAFGTPYYISPEQIRGEVDIDFRADIYSLGATFYHMVTGRVPFDGPTPVAVMQKHLREPLIPPDHINTNLSAGVGEVIEVMMAKDRNRRYSSTKDLLMDLEAIAAGKPPLQARRQLDANVLVGLAEEAKEEPVETVSPNVSTNMLVYIIILGGALVVSLLLNLIQFISRS